LTAGAVGNVHGVAAKQQVIERLTGGLRRGRALLGDVADNRPMASEPSGFPGPSMDDDLVSSTCHRRRIYERAERPTDANRRCSISERVFRSFDDEGTVARQRRLSPFAEAVA
jgi:hypothetical protein